MTNIKNVKVMNEYFTYLRSDEATIVYLAKNLVKSVDTKNKWIDVVEYDKWGSKGDKPAFNYIIVEIFNRKIHPIYPKDAIPDLKKAITWKTAHEDIAKQRSKGIRGTMYFITCQLFNKNKGRRETIYLDHWNEEYGGFDYTGKVPTTTIARKVNMKPYWDYRITGNRKIDSSQIQHIHENYAKIHSRILQESDVKIDWFFVKSQKNLQQKNNFKR